MGWALRWSMMASWVCSGDGRLIGTLIWFVYSLRCVGQPGASYALVPIVVRELCKRELPCRIPASGTPHCTFLSVPASQ